MPALLRDRQSRVGCGEVKAMALRDQEKEIPLWLCVLAAINEPELVKEFDRLRGTNLSLAGKPIELLIDESTGRMEHDFEEFVEFVRDCIYERVNST